MEEVQAGETGGCCCSGSPAPVPPTVPYNYGATADRNPSPRTRRRRAQRSFTRSGWSVTAASVTAASNFQGFIWDILFQMGFFTSKVRRQPSPRGSNNNSAMDINSSNTNTSGPSRSRTVIIPVPPPPGGSLVDVDPSISVTSLDQFISQHPQLQQHAFELVIEGMSCASCASRVEKALCAMSGVLTCSVDFPTSLAHLTTTGKEAIDAAEKSVVKLGYRVVSVTACGQQMASEERRVRQKALERSEELHQLYWDCIWCSLLSLPILLVMFGMMLASTALVPSSWLPMMAMHSGRWQLGMDVLQLISATPIVLFFGARRFFLSAWHSLLRGTFTMDTLVTVGAGSTYLYSLVVVIGSLWTGQPERANTYFDTAGLLCTFMLFGRYLEANAKRETCRALLTLMSFVPSRATLVTAHGTVSIACDSIRVGDRLRVVAGDRFPTDGKILEGVTEVDEQMITGECAPRPAHPGDRVVGGSLNLSGSIVMEAQRVGEETMLSGIIRCIQNAQRTKPAVQQLADRMAAYFVPVVLTIAFLTLAVWLVLGERNVYPEAWRLPKGPVAFAFEFFIATVVVACPCALGLATPTAIMVSTGVGAEHGVLVKSAVALESSYHATCVVFDKTGTLTTGTLTVVADHWAPTAAVEEDGEPLWWGEVVRQVAGQSKHPASAAVEKHLMSPQQQQKKNQNSKVSIHVEGVVTHPGEGLEAHVRLEREGVQELTTVWMGNTRLMNRCAAEGNSGEAVGLSDVDSQNFLQKHRSHGHSIVAVAIGSRLAALLALADEVKANAKAVIATLHHMGLRTVIVTGDHRQAAESVARTLGIDLQNVYAEVLPVDKASIVRSVQEREACVVFVGDGINDAPALVQADVGVALGGGAEVACEAADVVLTREDGLEDLICLRDLAYLTVRRVYGNFIWAVGYNMLMLPLACGLLFPIIRHPLPPLLAGVSMICSSLCVLMSSLSIRRFHPRQLEGEEDEDEDE